MLSRTALLCSLILTAVVAAPSAAQLAAPGLGLDREDLRDDVAVMTSADVDPRAKGVYGASVVGLIFGGVPRLDSMPTSICVAGCDSAFGGSPGTPVVLSNTLIPPNGMGIVGVPGLYGVIAALYEPDSIKRSLSGSGMSRVQMKQKNYMGIREIAFSYSTYFTPIDSMVAVSGCKGQLDIRTDPSKGVQKARFKLDCNTKKFAEMFGDDEAAVRQAISKAIFKKSKIGFDLRGETTWPPPQ